MAVNSPKTGAAKALRTMVRLKFQVWTGREEASGRRAGWPGRASVSWSQFTAEAIHRLVPDCRSAGSGYPIRTRALEPGVLGLNSGSTLCQLGILGQVASPLYADFLICEVG